MVHNIQSEQIQVENRKMNGLRWLALGLGLAATLSASITALRQGGMKTSEEINDADAATAKRIRDSRRRQLERTIIGLDELRQQYFEFHNRTLEDEEAEQALLALKERPENSWGEMFAPKIREAVARREKYAAMADKNETEELYGRDRVRRLQTKNSGQGFIITGLSPGLAVNLGGGAFWCLAIRKITKNGKVRQGQLTLKNCEFTPENEIAITYTPTFTLFWESVSGVNVGNIFGRDYCVGVPRPKKSARLRTEVCDPLNPYQVFGLLVEDGTIRPDFGPNECATARPKRSSVNGGGRIALKQCGGTNFAPNQAWLICYRAAECTIDAATGLLVCQFDVVCQ